jgi:hypothetical protein
MFTATRLTVSFGQSHGNVAAEASEDIEDIEDEDEEVDEVEEEDFLDERRVTERNGAVAAPSGAQIEEEMWKEEEEEEEEEEEAGESDIIVSTMGTGIVSMGEGEGDYVDEFENLSGGEEAVE